MADGWGVLMTCDYSFRKIQQILATASSGVEHEFERWAWRRGPVHNINKKISQSQLSLHYIHSHGTLLFMGVGWVGGLLLM